MSPWPAIPALFTPPFVILRRTPPLLFSAFLGFWLLGFATPRSVFAAGYENADIGEAGGGAVQKDDTLILSGSGHGVGGSGDTFHFVWKQGNDPQIVEAQLIPGENTEAALTIRESTDPLAPAIWVGIDHEGTIQIGRRTSLRGQVYKRSIASQGETPLWMRMTRTGLRIHIFASNDGLIWREIDSFQHVLSQKVLAGFAAAGINPGTAVFKSFRVESSSEEKDASEVGVSSFATSTIPEEPAYALSADRPQAQPAASPTQAEAAALSYEDLAHLLPEEKRNGRLVFIDAATGSDDLADTAAAGRAASPLRTIATALDRAVDGDILILMPGTHWITGLNPGDKQLAIAPMAGAIISGLPQ